MSTAVKQNSTLNDIPLTKDINQNNIIIQNSQTNIIKTQPNLLTNHAIMQSATAATAAAAATAVGQFQPLYCYGANPSMMVPPLSVLNNNGQMTLMPGSGNIGNSNIGGVNMKFALNGLYGQPNQFTKLPIPSQMPNYQYALPYQYPVYYQTTDKQENVTKIDNGSSTPNSTISSVHPFNTQTQIDCSVNNRNVQSFQTALSISQNEQNQEKDSKQTKNKFGAQAIANRRLNNTTLASQTSLKTASTSNGLKNGGNNTGPIRYNFNILKNFVKSSNNEHNNFNPNKRQSVGLLELDGAKINLAHKSNIFSPRTYNFNDIRKHEMSNMKESKNYQNLKAKDGLDHVRRISKSARERSTSRTKMIVRDSSSNDDDGIDKHTIKTRKMSNKRNFDKKTGTEKIIDGHTIITSHDKVKHRHVIDSKTSTVTVTTTKSKKSKPPKPVKKVIVINLPENLSTIESVTHLCQKYGEILLVRVLKPGKALPHDLKLYSARISDLGTTVCAIIEFETAASAKNAVEEEKKNNLRLALLQPGADLSLYGPLQDKANSVHSSQHTHDESGIEVNATSSEFHTGSSSNTSNRGSLSNNSTDDLDSHHGNRKNSDLTDISSLSNNKSTTKKINVSNLKKLNLSDKNINMVQDGKNVIKEVKSEGDLNALQKSDSKDKKQSKNDDKINSKANSDKFDKKDDFKPNEEEIMRSKGKKGRSGSLLGTVDNPNLLLKNQKPNSITNTGTYKSPVKTYADDRSQNLRPVQHLPQAWAHPYPPFSPLNKSYCVNPLSVAYPHWAPPGPGFVGPSGGNLGFPVGGIANGKNYSGRKHLVPNGYYNSGQINRYLNSNKHRNSMPILPTQGTFGWPLINVQSIPENIEKESKTSNQKKKKTEDKNNMNKSKKLNAKTENPLKLIQATITSNDNYNGERRESELNIKAPTFIPRKSICGEQVGEIDLEKIQVEEKKKVEESVVTNTTNGRVMTSLCVTLTPVKRNGNTRTINKLDLTNKRHPKDEEKFGRHSPPLLSNPSDNLLLPSGCCDVDEQADRLKAMNTSDDSYKSQVKCKKYTRDYLMALKEAKHSLQFPNNLPNIPELLPTSKQAVITNSTGYMNNNKQQNRFNYYKYNNNQHHNNHFNNNTTYNGFGKK